MATQQTSAYSFSSQPKAVSATRKKYREPGESIDLGVYRNPKETCITWDKRVHRGNTYGLYTQNAIRDALQEVVTPAQAPRPRRKPVEPSIFDMPLPEEEKVAIDLSRYLVADEGEAVKVETVEAQTDEFLPEPPREMYRPQKTGIDVSTQVEIGDLYDFDYEVEPILDVLVNKTLEQAIMETEEEDELLRMKDFKAEWHTRQDSAMKDWADQVAEEQARWHEKEQVMAVRRAAREREARLLLKIQAVAAAKLHLSALVPNAVNDLATVALPDPMDVTVIRAFMPALISEVQREIEAASTTSAGVANIAADGVRGQVNRQREGYTKHKQRTMALRKQRLEELQIRRGKIRIAVSDGAGGERLVGPVQLSTKDSIEDLQARVYEWLQTYEASIATAWPRGVLLAVCGSPVKATEEIFSAKPGTISMQQPPEILEEAAAEAAPEDGAEAEAE